MVVIIAPPGSCEGAEPVGGVLVMHEGSRSARSGHACSSRQRVPNPNNAANIECNPLHVGVPFLIKELSLGLGSLCLLRNAKGKSWPSPVG